MEKHFKNWWLMTVKGGMMLVYGVLVMFLGFDTLQQVEPFFAGMALLSAALLIIGAASNTKNNDEWSWWLAEGMFDLLFAAMVLSDITASAIDTTSALSLLIALWCGMTAIFMLTSAFRSSETGVNAPILVLGSVISLVVAGLILFNPFGYDEAIFYLIGIQAIGFGISLAIISFDYKYLDDDDEDETPARQKQAAAQRVASKA